MKLQIVKLMKSGLHNIIALFGISFILISTIGLMSIKDNFATAQKGNATLGFPGNKSGAGPLGLLSQLGQKFNETFGSNVSKGNIVSFMEKLRSNGSISNLVNNSSELNNGSGMNLSALLSK